jgi:hypothetical protein
MTTADPTQQAGHPLHSRRRQTRQLISGESGSTAAAAYLRSRFRAPASPLMNRRAHRSPR